MVKVVVHNRISMRVVTDTDTDTGNKLNTPKPRKDKKKIATNLDFVVGWMNFFWFSIWIVSRYPAGGHKVKRRTLRNTYTCMHAAYEQQLIWF